MCRQAGSFQPRPNMGIDLPHRLPTRCLANLNLDQITGEIVLATATQYVSSDFFLDASLTRLAFLLWASIHSQLKLP
jgi:hypothetical protein